MAGNGTEIKVITNSAESGANVIGSADLYNEKDNLLKTGIKLYEQVSDASIHTKSLLIDEAISVIGSFNVDMRSTYIDTETMVVIHCKPINEKLRQQADFAMSQSRMAVDEKNYIYGEKMETKELGWGKRLAILLLRVIDPLIRWLL